MITPELNIVKKPEKKETINFGAGAEAKIRQLENSRNKQAVSAVPEGRMRLQESSRFGSSVEKNTTKAERNKYVGMNPFETAYDESKNPFSEDDYSEKKEMDDDYDYDKNLNPFAS